MLLPWKQPGNKKNVYCSADITHADITHADIARADITHADIAHADITHADIVLRRVQSSYFKKRLK